MKQYSQDKIRNIAIAGHGGSGKTSLVEAMLFKSKMIDRMGKVADGNTVSDFDADEIKRKVSINTSIVPIEWKDCKFNLLDTPGLFDFAGEMYQGIYAADSVLINVSGKSGVSVGVKKAYKIAKKNNKPVAFFVSKLDSESADFYKVHEQLKTAFGPTVCPIVVPHMDGDKVDCYINLVQMKAYAYTDRQAHEIPLPELGHRIDGLINAMSEAVAETDEELFEKYFAGEPFTQEELIKGVHKGIEEGIIAPIMCGSATEIEGISALLDIMMNIFPNPSEVGGVEVLSGDDIAELKCDVNGPAVAYVFKTVVDPFVGKLSYIKVLSGKITSDATLTNTTTGEQEKLSKLLCLRGKKQEEVKELVAGDIGAIAKISANTFDMLCAKGAEYKLDKPQLPLTCYSMAIKTKAKGDEGKISNAVARLLEEDLTLSYVNDAQTHQQVLSGLGEQHLDVAITKLKNKFGVDVLLEKPIVAYRETIRKKVKVEGKHKKQTGGHGQFGHVWIEFEPCESEDLVFEESVFGGAVPRSFFPAVEKGLRECAVKGVLAGYPVVGLKATLVDGSYHPVDSSEMSFKMAASIAYREGLTSANPILLEPIGNLKVSVPDENTGDMMGELNKLRGRVLGMNPTENEEGMTTIESEVPLSETHDFATLVRQMTKGSGSFTISFERYEPLPQHLEADVIAKAKELFAE